MSTKLGSHLPDVTLAAQRLMGETKVLGGLRQL